MIIIIGLLVYFIIAFIFMVIVGVILSEYDEKSQSWKCYHLDDWGNRVESFAIPVAAGIVWPLTSLGLLSYLVYEAIIYVLNKVLNKTLSIIKESEKGN